MNRREAVAALVALPGVVRISTAPVKPTDVIVVEKSDVLSREAIERIAAMLRQVWPGHKVVVLSEGMTLKVVEGV